MFYVYHLKSSLDNKIFYIGKGSGNRMYKHLQIATGNNDNQRSKNPHLYNKILKILNEGGHIIYEKVFITDNETLAYESEVKEIEKYGLANLTNISVGGLGGFRGVEWTPERRKKLSESKKGIPRSLETKKKISNSLKGKPTGNSYWKGKTLSDETKNKMSNSGKGKNSGPMSEKHRLAIIEGIKRKKLNEQNRG
jgi:hypothetical protein